MIKTHDLLLAVLVARNQIDSLHVSDVHLVAQNVSIKNLGNISAEQAARIEHADIGRTSGQLTFSSGNRPNCHLIRGRAHGIVKTGNCGLQLSCRSRTFKFLSYIRHLLIDALLLQVPNASPANICDELAESISGERPR